MVKELVLTIVVKKEKTKYSAWCPELDVASQGNSMDDARKNLKEAVECHVEAMLEQGDIKLLLEKLGLSEQDFKNKNFILPESFSGNFEIAISA